MILGPIGGDRGTTEPLKAGFLAGGAIATPQTAANASKGTAGALATPAHAILAAAASVAPLRAFAELFYFRIWAIPAVLDVQNPKRDFPIPFDLWSAYLEPNTLNAITSTGALGLTLDAVPPTTFGRLELRTVHATIGATAPIQIDATFSFAFDEGTGTLRFIALLADILPIVAEGTIVEKLEWKTDVLTNYDGSEQRIALRQRPRRTFQVQMLLGDDADRKRLYDKLFKTAALTVITPSYQYQSRLKVATVIGDNKLYTNTRRADLRVGENVIVATYDGTFFMYEVATVLADHVTITTAFSQVVDAGAIVCGGFAGHFGNKSGLAMQQRGGKAQLSILLTDSRSQVAWPGYAATVPTFNGKPLLLKNPLANNDAQENFDVGLATIDNMTGKPAYYSAWSQALIEGERQYLIQSLFNQDDLEFWRTFLDTVRGSQKTFYTPTYRNDLVHMAGTPFLPGELVVEGTDYATQYFGHAPFNQIDIETSVGTFQLAIDNIENLGDSTKLHFVTPIPVDVSHADITRISYLMLVRFGSDSISLTHNPANTIVDTSLRMAVQ